MVYYLPAATQGARCFLQCIGRCWFYTILRLFYSSYTRAVYPPRLQILSIDGEGMIDDVTKCTAHDLICDKKKRKKDVVGIVKFDLIDLLPTNHIIAYITTAYRSL